MGILIALDGIDGSGKTTQALSLYDELKKERENVKYLSFPDYESKSSTLVKMYLDGEFGDNSNDVNPYAASSFYAVDRFSSYTLSWKNLYQCENSLIIANRYTTANAIHQISKLDKSEWNGFLDWLYDFEFQKLGLPKPDLTIFFDMHIDVSLRLIAERNRQTDTERDIHERDDSYLRRSYEAAKYVADYLKWETLYCYQEKDGLLMPKTKEHIFDELKLLINRKLNV